MIRSVKDVYSVTLVRADECNFKALRSPRTMTPASSSAFNLQHTTRRAVTTYTTKSTELRCVARSRLRTTISAQNRSVSVCLTMYSRIAYLKNSEESASLRASNFNGNYTSITFVDTSDLPCL
ncbi:phosphatidylinositol 3-kinase [Trypanosoma cruzi]|nr:phosphatidylinositol 3-kinase [Trypanosoma cruzi]